MLRTKKWKALSLLLAMVMVAALLPAVVFAAGPTVSFDAAPTFDEATEKISFTATITTATNDITMLALRHDGAALTAVPDDKTDAELENMIMYIDQQTSDASGKYTWNFGLRDTTSGNNVTIFIGGEDVETFACQTVEISVAANAPALSIATPAITAGDDLVISYTADAAYKTALDASGAVYLGDEATPYAAANVVYGDGTITVKGLAIGASYSKVTVKANDYKDAVVTSAISVTAKAKGTAELVAPAKGFDGAYILNVDEIKVTLEDSATAGWLAAATIDVVDAENTSIGSVNKSTGIVELNSGAVERDAVLSARITFAAENYAPQLALPFTVVSNIAATEVAAAASTFDDDTYDFTIPEDVTTNDLETTVTYAVTVDGVDYTIPASRTFSIDRNDAGGVAKAVVITATVADTNSVFESKATEKSVSVLPKGEDPSSIIEDDVKIVAPAAGAYGQAGMMLVIIKNTNAQLDAATQTALVGDVELYYIAAKDKFYGVIPTATAAEVVAAFRVEEAASETVIMGKASGNTDAISAADFAAVKRIVLKKSTGDAKTWIASDVGSGAMDATIAAADFAALKRIVLKKDTVLAIVGNDEF